MTNKQLALAGYADAYRASRHYQDGDRVDQLCVGVGMLSSPYMTLVIERDGVWYRLPFYFDQEDGGGDAAYVERAPWAFAVSMFGATDWVEWMDATDLEEV